MLCAGHNRGRAAHRHRPAARVQHGGVVRAGVAARGPGSGRRRRVALVGNLRALRLQGRGRPLRVGGRVLLRHRDGRCGGRPRAPRGRPLLVLRPRVRLRARRARRAAPVPARAAGGGAGVRVRAVLRHAERRDGASSLRNHATPSFAHICPFDYRIHRTRRSACWASRGWPSW